MKQFLVHLLESVDALLELDIVRWELRLGSNTLSQQLVINTDRGFRVDEDTLSSAVPSCSLTYCCVRAAKGEKEDLWTNQICI